MENVTFIEVDTIGGKQTHAIIANEDGSTTSMLKSTYDEMIKTQDANKL